jgi:hypothetical protein
MSDNTQQEKNRKVVYNLITTNYYNNNNPETYDVWFAKWFANENTFSKGKNSLFDFLYGNREKIFAKDNPIRKKIEVNDNRTYYWRNFACDLSWAGKFNICSGIINKPINFDDKVGDYTTDKSLIKKISIFKDFDEADPTKENLYINSAYFDKLPKLGNYNLADYSVFKLTQLSANSPVFTLSNQSGQSLLNTTITFDNTNTEFTFEFLDFKIKATKITKSETDNSTKKDDTVVKKDDTVVKKNKDDEIPVVRTKPLYFDTDKKDDTPTNPCSDFPFTLGCINTKIGDLNAKLFRGDRKNDTYTKRLQNLLDNSGNFGDDNVNKELTKDLWNDLMNRQVIKESVKKVLKEYINKKK